MIGATPIWAATVTPIASPHALGPGTRSARKPPSVAMPNEAPTESWKPTDRTSRGSTRSSPVTASASTRTDPAGRPVSVAVAATTAIADALRTEGSKRVSSPNDAINATVTDQRHPRRSRRRSGPASTRTNATFWPETTITWVRPDARKSSTISTGWPLSSPRTKPRYSDRCSAGIAAAPSTSTCRTRLAARHGHAPSSSGSTRSAINRPTTWRGRSQGLFGRDAARRPSTLIR